MAHVRICLAAFILDAAVGIVMVALPFFVYDTLGGTETMSGTIGAITSAAYAVACIISLRFLRRIDNVIPLAALGALWNCAVFGLTFLCRAPWLFCLVMSLSSMGNAVVWPGLHSWVGGEHDPRRRARHMAWFNISWSAGLAVGPFVGGLLYDASQAYPFMVVPAMGLFVAVLIASVPHERHQHGVATADVLEKRAGHDRLGEAYLRCVWLAALMAWAMVGVARLVFPKRVQDLVSAGEMRLLFEDHAPQWLQSGEATIFSYMSTTLSAASCLVFLCMGAAHFWHHRFRYLLLLQAASALALWVLGLANSLALMMAAYTVLGVMSGAAFFSSVYYGTADPAKKHGRTAINEAIVGGGLLLGAQSFALLALKFPMESLLRYSPLALAAFVVIQYVLLRRGKRRWASGPGF